MSTALEYIFGRYSNVPPFFLEKTMYKILSTISISITLTLISVSAVKAQVFIAGQSGTIKSQVLDNGYDHHEVSGKHKVFDFRVENLRNYLQKYNSPLTEYAADFVNYADTYGLDYRLVPAITGVESTYGKRIPYKSYNAYGWANGEYKFNSWEDSIGHVSMSLRTKYIDKGAGTINKIARRYAPPSVTWAPKVKNIMGKIDKLPLSYDI